MTMLPNRQYLRPIEVAEYFGVTRRTVQNWIYREVVDSIKIGRVVRVTRDSVISLMVNYKKSWKNDENWENQGIDLD